MALGEAGHVVAGDSGHGEGVLRVGLIAPPWLAVPPPRYGGTEVVVDVLARGLSRAGCDVLLFTTGDATCPVPRRWFYSEALGTNAPAAAELAHVEAAYRTLTDVDVIHDHSLAGPTRIGHERSGVPVVATVHGSLPAEVRARYARAGRDVNLVAISEAQRRSAPEVPFVAVIHHGLDIDAFPLGRGDGGYLLFLGRMHADKGPHRAIAIARAAGKRIVLAAKIWEPAEHEYFNACVRPLLGPDAVYVGQVGGEEKLAWLAGAEALVNPIRWNEPFGLVMIEALACGTPVLSFAEGAAPEIVETGRNGFLCTDEADMAAKVALVAGLDRAECRRTAEERFSATRMVEDHLALYRNAIDHDADNHLTSLSR